MNKFLLNTINHLDIAAPLVALFFAWFRKEKRLGEHVYIVAYLLIQLSLNTGAKIIYHCDLGRNIYMYQTNTLLSFIILSLYFLQKWQSYAQEKKFRYARIGIGLIAGAILGLFFFEGDNAYNSISSSLNALLICTYCILYYYAKLNNPDIEKITTTRSFWFVSGLFMYYAGCFFIFLSFKFLTLAKIPHASIVWTLHNIIFVPMCTAISIGFRCSTYRKI